MKKAKLGWRISVIAAACVALFYVITLDNVSNVAGYGIAFLCLVWVLFALVVNWNDIIRGEEETEIVDLFEYKNRW